MTDLFQLNHGVRQACSQQKVCQIDRLREINSVLLTAVA